MTQLLKKIVCFLLGFCFAYSSQSQTCSGLPKFVKKWGFDEGRIALSTSERHLRGLVLVELESGDPRNAKRLREFQHPTWDDVGYLSSIARDNEGNIYVAPKPNVSTLYTNNDELNSIFKVDSKTGVMKKFCDLQSDFKANIENPYGILAVHYSCDAKALFASSLLGSTSSEENGVIYSVDVKTTKCTPVLEDVDAIGLCVFRSADNAYVMIYSSARNSNIYEVFLDRNLKVISKPKMIISLEGLGPEGDNKARKIIYNSGKLQITGTSFNYNLSVPMVELETNYEFLFDKDRKIWRLVGIQ